MNRTIARTATVAGLAATLTLPAGAASTPWKIDPQHSSAQFAVRHLGLSTVRGAFSKLDGTMLVDDTDITALPMYKRAGKGISYLPQEASVFRKLSVEENLMAILETLPLRNRERHENLDRLIEQLGLEKVRRSKGYMLSGGERRRVEIARSLVINPSFLLLDEPFSGIDPIQVLELQRIIFDLKRANIGILVTDHNVRETLMVTDRAYIIDNGRIFRAGSPEALARDPEVKRVYLGESFSLQI